MIHDRAPHHRRFGPRKKPRAALVGVLAMTSGPLACGQASHWLAADAALPGWDAVAPAELGRPLTLRVLRQAAARPLETTALTDDACAWFCVRAGATQMNADAPPRAERPKDAIEITPSRAGGTMIGLDTRPVVQTFEAADLRAFLAARGSIAPGVELPAAGLVRVYRLETMKLILRVAGPAGFDAADATANAVVSKTGHQVEIRPIFDATSLGIPSDVPVRVFAWGDKLPAARVIATHEPSGAVQDLTADGGGFALLRLDRAGWWRVEAHRLVPMAALPRDAGMGAIDAQAVLLSGTLTIHAGGGPPAEGAAPPHAAHQTTTVAPVHEEAAR